MDSVRLALSSFPGQGLQSSKTHGIPEPAGQGPLPKGNRRKCVRVLGGGWNHAGPPSPAPSPLLPSLASPQLLPLAPQMPSCPPPPCQLSPHPCATLTVQDTCRVLGPRTMGSCILTATSASPCWPFHGSSTGLDRLLSVDQRAQSAEATKGKKCVLRLCLCSVPARLTDCNALQHSRVRESFTEVTRRSS